ncbi:SH3 and multiple ankyrin repeat domains protein 2b [Diretmus argenteus]
METSRIRKKVHFRDARADRAERRKLFRNYTVGSYDSFDASSDCVVDEKTVVLQKRDNEGFGFVLRGAKADTPIEEFTPTPAFPALQYLESVDEGGVAWQAGLRTGDFLIEVNQDNVVKVGHKQVVNMIRHGGNRLIIKVVTVSRNLDPDDTSRKKAPPPPRRAPSTALSMAMRSKSMTSELEELGVPETSYLPMSTNNSAWDDDRRSMCESQDVSMQTQAVPGGPRAAYLGVPRQGTMRRQKSIGITEEEKQFLTPPMLKFTRSLSMPDTSEDIPPPPASSPPSPPSSTSSSPYPTSPQPQGRGYGTMIHPGFAQDNNKGGQNAPERGGGGEWRGGNGGGADPGLYYRDAPAEEVFSADNYSNHGKNGTSSPLTAQQSFLNRRAAQIPENPYSDLGKLCLFTPNKPARRKGMLVKQSKIEDSPEKVCSIPIPTIIIKEPSTSSSGKSSQGSSMEVETGVHDLPGQLRPDDSSNSSNTFASAMSGAMRERRLVDHRNSVSFRSTDLGDEDMPPSPLPRLRQSKSIDEGMFSSDERLRRLVAPPSSLLNLSRPAGGGGGGGGNVTDFNSPEPTIVRELLNTRTGLHHHHHHLSPLSLPAKSYTPSSSSSSPSSSSGQGPYVHPVTGKPLDPNSPLALALAARDQAMREQNQPLPLKSEPSKPDLNKPLFIDTKLARPSVEVGFASTTTTAAVRTGPRGGLRRQMTESKYETETKYEHPLAQEEKRRQETKKMLIDIVDTSQQKSAGLLMVHTTDRTRSDSSLSGEEREEQGVTDSTPGELRDPNQPAPPSSTSTNHQTAPPIKTISICSVEEPIKLPFGMIPPPPLASVDIPEEELFPDPLPPPLEFANSFDIPEDQVSTIAELLKQTKNPSSLSAQDQSNAIAELLKQTRGPSSVSASAARHASLTPFYATHLPPNNNNEIKRATAVLTNCMAPSFPASVLLESYEPISDSGIEDSRSSGDPQMETTSTISTVSSISTLSSEGGEGLDTCTVYADGQAFPGAALISKSNKPGKAKPHNLYTNSREAGMVGGGGGGPPSSIPPPPSGEAPKTPIQQVSRLWGEGGEGKGPLTPKPGDTSESATRTVFGSRNPDNPSGVPHRNTVTFASSTIKPLSCQQAPSSHSGSSQNPRPSSPVLSAPDSGLGPPPSSSSSSLPISAASPSPTMTDMFGLPTPPLSLGTGRSRSPSPLTLIQNTNPSSTPSNKPFISKHLQLWSKADVADWLDSLNLSEHREAFLDNDIEGSHLPSLQKDDLIDLGVTRVGHRMNIERALKVMMDR